MKNRPKAAFVRMALPPYSAAQPRWCIHHRPMRLWGRAGDGLHLVYSFDAQSEDTGIADLLKKLEASGIAWKDLESSQSSLEDIFVSLVRNSSAASKKETIRA